MNEQTKPAQHFVVVRGVAGDPGALKGAIVAIGNFDGVHRGHRAVIDTARSRAQAAGRPVAALTFEPHPRVFLRPGEPLFRLTEEAAKLRLLAAAGLDGAVVLAFDASLASLSAEEFIARILIGRFAISGAVIGFDFHFGKNRGGSPAYLAEQGKARGFSVDIVPPLEDEGRPVSSGTIRAALAAGRVVEAAELMGHPWFVTAKVIHGDKRGRALGFPTANLALDPACGLKHGIYAVRVGLGGKRLDGVASFGRRPMFDSGAVLLEVFLFDFDADLYGETIDIAFIGWLRHEQRFDSVDELVRRMQEDSARAREVLARASDAYPPI
jgi:riboflavin kinase/FMN adenylyltransferase